jgi:hypothetical protein
MGRYYCGVKQGPAAAGRTDVSVGWQKLGCKQWGRGEKKNTEKIGKSKGKKTVKRGGQSRNYLLINRSPVTGKNVMPRNDEKS